MCSLMTHSQSKMVRRSLGYPAFEKSSHVRLEEPARVGVSGGWYWTYDTFAFAENELEPTAGGD